MKEILGWILLVAGVLMIGSGLFMGGDKLREVYRVDEQRHDPIYGHHARMTSQFPRVSSIIAGLFFLSFGMYLADYIEFPLTYVLKLIDKIWAITYLTHLLEIAAENTAD